MPRPHFAALGAFTSALLLLPPWTTGRTAEARQLGANASVTGHVLDGSTNGAVAGALVTLGGNPVRRVVADGTGQFEFTALPPGSYTVRADRPGYLSTSAGQRSPNGLGQPIAVIAGQRADVDLSMWKTSSVAGRVTAATPAAPPIVGADVHALSRTVVNGEWRWIDAGRATSDDRGHYQIGSLTPGDYLVVARPVQDPETPLLIALLTANPASAADVMAGVASTSQAAPELDSRVLTSALAYYTPATSAAARSPIVAIAPAVAKTALDLHVRQTHGVSVSGRLIGSTSPTSGLIVRLLAPIPDVNGRDRGDQDIEVAASACDEDGRFEFSGVPSGQYALDLSWMPPIPAQPPAPPDVPGRGMLRPAPPPPPAFSSEPALWSRVPITVAATNVANIEMPVRTGATVTGRVIAGDASTPVMAIESTALRLDPVLPPFVAVPTMIPPRMVVDREGRITSASLPPGRYVMRATAPRGWNVVSAMTGGIDILDRPVDISSTMTDLVLTLTDHPLGVLTGSIAADPAAAGVVTVVIFPAQADLRTDSSAASRRVRAIRAQESGAFSIGNLPPGDYEVLAVPGDLPAGWQRGQALAAYEQSAQRVAIALGATSRVTLEVHR